MRIHLKEKYVAVHLGNEGKICRSCKPGITRCAGLIRSYRPQQPSGMYALIPCSRQMSMWW